MKEFKKLKIEINTEVMKAKKITEIGDAKKIIITPGMKELQKRKEEQK